MRRTKQVKPDVFRTMLEPQPFDLSVGCTDSLYMSVLIQHIRGCKTVREMLTEQTFQHILPILFQVYYPLFHMRKNFTHYDLHMDNVILYEPVPGKYIQYHYQTETGVISFKSPFIVKLIDYGRCYFKDGEDSKDIYDQVCQLPECVKCGEDSGFGNFKLSNERNFYHIVSQKKNESHDLRLLNGINNSLNSIMMENDNKNDTYKSMHSIVSKVRYGVGIDYEDQKQFGTKENTKLHLSGETIANVTDAYIQLKTHIEKQGLINENQAKYSNPDDQLGILHIYANGNPMVYESSSSK
jgi:hypothetical protein